MCTKTVLFIDDDQPQLAENDLFLKQGMGPHHHQGNICSDQFPGLVAFCGLELPAQKRERNVQVRKPLFHVSEMLLGK